MNYMPLHVSDVYQFEVRGNGIKVFVWQMFSVTFEYTFVVFYLARERKAK